MSVRVQLFRGCVSFPLMSLMGGGGGKGIIVSIPDHCLPFYFVNEQNILGPDVQN